MSDINDRYLKIKTELRPFWESLVRAVHERGMYITGFVYGEVEPPDPAGPMLLRFGNVWAESPAEMFMIHWQLAQMAAQMESEGNMTREVMHMEPSDGFSGPSGLKTPNSLEIADMLVLSLLAVPVEAIPDHIQELVQKYADSRRPEGK